ncbi:hypothetical protein [Dictyobacter aurantiacus]|uniref:Cytochrome c oxidase polypeptide IV n=1 Tax=Dictyobacter aurantiacus TaxID=1936993 RepID=A0A401ZBQ3_9CHLR|nr:hypothetical protein [Dictyobacter aurantiacus]GCE04295.1 hypothetical protein KDAU_16240 [Dictyobacter aurantiacus]
MSQEQTNRVEQPVPVEENGVSAAPLAAGTPTSDSAPADQQQMSQEEGTTTGAQPQPDPKKGSTGRKRTRAKGRLVNAEEVMPRPSLWPLGLAFSLAFVLFGVVSGPIVLGIGIVLLVISGAGWALERR